MIEERKRARRLSISHRELLIATAESDLKKVDDLLKTDVDVNFKDRDGNAALHWAVECGNVKAIELLLSKGASVHIKNNKEESPLDIAKSLDNQRIIDILRPPTPLPSQNDETPKEEANSEPSLCSTLNTLSIKGEQELCGFQEVEHQADIVRQAIQKMNDGIDLVQKDQYNEALPILEEAYEIHTKILGEAHADSIKIQRYVAMAERGIGNLDKSLQISKHAYEIQKNTYGPDSPVSLLIGNDIGVTLYKQRKFTESLEILQDSLKKCEFIFSLEHPATLITISCIQEILKRLQVHDRSYTPAYISYLAKYKREILKYEKEKVGGTRRDYLDVKYEIATAFYESDQLDEALTMLKEICKEGADLTNSSIISIKQTIHKILTSQKKFQEALEIAKEILYAQEISLGKGHKDTFATKVMIAINLHNLNKNSSALQIFREISKPANNTIFNSVGINPIKEWMDRVEINISVLFKYIRSNNYVRLQKLFDDGHEVNSIEYNGITLLHYAASMGQIKTVEVLLKNGADINMVTGYGYTALHDAALTGSLHVIKLLLQHGSMYNVRDKKGAIPLDLCKDKRSRRLLMSVEEIFEGAAKGNPEILEKLEKLQSDLVQAVLKARNQEGKTVLQVTITHGYKDLSRKVIEFIRGEK